MEMQIDIGRFACRIVRIKMGLREGRLIRASRNRGPLRCCTCAVVSGSCTLDSLSYGGADAASGGAKHEGHGTILAPVDHRAVASLMGPVDGNRAVCDGHMKSSTRIATGRRRVRIELQKQT